MRLTALFPLALSIVAFVLSLLCILAGRKPGFMEDYHIVALNTSTLGHNLINSTATTTSPSTPTSTSSGLGSIFSSLTGEIDNITSSIEGDLNGIVNDLADDLAQALGIKQWYSLHMMDGCEGTFSPNATSKKASYNVTNCTAPVGMYHFNPTATIQNELAENGLNISLSDIDYPSDIQHGINDLNTALDATFVLYCIGIAGSGIAIFGALLAFFLYGSRLLSFGNWGLCTIAFLSLLIASTIVTVAQTKLTHEVNKYGNDIGIFAYKGTKFLGLTWGAVAAIFVASGAWVIEFCVGRMKESRSYNRRSPSSRWRFRPRQSRGAKTMADAPGA